MDSNDPLGSHFFVIDEEFGRQSSINPNEIEPNTFETWMNDNDSDHCVLCKDKFHPILKRRHHCRYCGLLMCGNCTGSSAVINDKVERVCDACAAIILPPNHNNDSYPGLRKWYSLVNLNTANFNAKQAAFNYISSFFTNENTTTHKYAVNTLLKMYKRYSPEMVKANCCKYLLLHAMHCKCASTAQTLDLFISLYMADPSNANIDFKDQEFASLDINTFFAEDSLEMKRAAARLLYLLVYEDKIKPSAVMNLTSLINYPDKWVSAFIMAAISYRIPRQNLDLIYDYEIKGPNIIDNAEQILPEVLKLFKYNSPNASTAGKYYAALFVEYISHWPEEAQVLAKCDLSHMMTCLVQCFPKNAEDRRPEIKTAVILTAVLQRLWIMSRNKVLDTETSRNLFSYFLMPLFEILEIKIVTQEKCLAAQLQIKFLSIMRIAAKYEDFKTQMKTDQMRSILKGLTAVRSTVTGEASMTISALGFPFD